MSELTTRLREILAAFAASDPTYKRFGAAQHRYALLPPVERVDLELAADYTEYVTRLSRGGVGPYYGLLPVERASAFVVSAPRGVHVWQRALPIAHLGCGYAALLILDGAAAGQVWLDARQLGFLEPIRPSFTAFLLDWIDRVSRNEWLDGFVPPGRCAITAALSGYLAVHEERLGLGAGELAGDPLRNALDQLGPAAIAVTVDEQALFEPGDRVDPCATCARALQGLVEQGLRPDVVATGVPPLPIRAVTPLR